MKGVCGHLGDIVWDVWPNDDDVDRTAVITVTEDSYWHDGPVDIYYGSPSDHAVLFICRTVNL